MIPFDAWRRAKFRFTWTKDGLGQETYDKKHLEVVSSIIPNVWQKFRNYEVAASFYSQALLDLNPTHVVGLSYRKAA